MPESLLTDNDRLGPVDRVLILANRRKPQVGKALEGFRPWLSDHATIIDELDTLDVHEGRIDTLPEADLAIVLGGDGTMLAQARALVDRQMPMLGVNFGKLGFLAEFNLNDLKEAWPGIATGKCRLSRRMMIDLSIYPPEAPRWGGDAENMPEPLYSTVAMNDAVVTAGPPYRMIEIDLAIEPALSQTSATRFVGDGVIVSTPSGSTAYNVAAGGPIVSPGVNGLCITAICPHTLAFRPIVFNADCDTWLSILRANEGTTLVIDGQISCDLDEGQQILVRKHQTPLRLVHNPKVNYWRMLSQKMHWAAPPTAE